MEYPCELLGGRSWVKPGLRDVLLPSCLAVLGVGSEIQISRGMGEERIGLSKGGVAITGPGIEFWFLGQFGFQGISFDVSAGLQEIGVVYDGQAFVAALPEVSGGSVNTSVVPGIGQLKPLKRGDQGLSVFGVEQQMDVVGHQAVVVTAQGRGFGEEFMKQPSIGFVIRRFMKNGLAVISPGQDVVGGLRCQCSSGAWHGYHLMKCPFMKRPLCLVPKLFHGRFS